MISFMHYDNTRFLPGNMVRFFQYLTLILFPVKKKKKNLTSQCNVSLYFMILQKRNQRSGAASPE